MTLDDPSTINATAQTPSTAWEEKCEPGENELFKSFAERVILERQKRVAGGGELMRGFHAKPHAGLTAEFEVLPDLPEYARHGVFREPKVFPAVVRFSNGRTDPGPDKRPEPRGIAIKLVGVPGDKLLEDERSAVTQDFLATSHSLTSTVRDMKQFMAFVELEKDGRVPFFQLARKVGIKEALRILANLLFTVRFSKVRSMATEHYGGTAPIKLGPYAVKFTVRPPEGTRPPADDLNLKDPNFLREELAARLREGDLTFDFVVQFYVDEKRTPIEDTSVRWKPEHAPFVRLARVRVPACDLDDPRTKALSDEINELAFTPWHAIEEHRPLGNVMRARKIAYPASAALRRHRPEPTSLPLKAGGE